ncbi:MAG TPA: di-trans,poly-cis-decaprenylcistransferase [Clostridiales bacterium]|jgi:undecaprenyl diphosphate synthase|nr:di-trans,poly-cis-decaprenylcistransferase [Clostridiales bacterium]
MNDRLPRHIAFIMDGNGRWALKKGLKRSIGHRYGVKALKRIFEYVFELGINYMSIYALSKENLKRPKEEIQTLIELLNEYIDDCLPQLIKNKIRLNIMGDISILDDSSQQKIKMALEDTKHYSDKALNIAFNYSGRDEIIKAANQAIKDGHGEINQEIFEKYLYTASIPDPDLIIRTSGEQRISNFMLYQSAYSEIYFTKTLWPDFTKKTLDAALDDYKKRHRKFGDIK